MQGVKIFCKSFSEAPFKALYRLFMDYLIFAGMVFFSLFLLIFKHPLALIDNKTGFKLREKFVAVIGILSKG